MDCNQAARILGTDLDVICTRSLSEAYRSASKTAHPDLGGSIVAQQQVVAAYETLKRYAVAAEASREKACKKAQEADTFAAAMARVDWEKFTEHLKATCSPFIQFLGVSRRLGTYEARWSGGDWQILLSVSSRDGGKADAHVSAMCNLRKVKFQSRDWALGLDFPLDPVKVFPVQKKKKSTKTFSREDFLTGITILGGTCGDYRASHWSIPLAGGALLVIERYTSMRAGGWHIHAIKLGKIFHKVWTDMREGEDLLKILQAFHAEFSEDRAAVWAEVLKDRIKLARGY